ncbi:MAG: DNA-formamidopyrimidine glycosylase family protein [Actinomycetes bacterium]
MPEGDTVWLHAKRLHGALAGSTLTGSDFRLPQLATTDLTGSTVRAVVSRGKHLLIRVGTLDDGAWSIRSHLRMDGTWRVFAPGERWTGRPAHTIRVVLSTARVTAVGFHLHDVEVVPTGREDELVGHLGPDLLGPGWDPVEAVRRVASQPDREIATALMDQRNLAGIGNFYKCEICFLRGTSPWTPVRDVKDLPAMVDLARRLLLANRERWAQVTTGDLRAGQNAYVFERGGRPCRRCRTPIRRARQGGDLVDDRVTYWCPTCQPGPSGR